MAESWNPLGDVERYMNTVLDRLRPCLGSPNCRCREDQTCDQTLLGPMLNLRIYSQESCSQSCRAETYIEMHQMGDFEIDSKQSPSSLDRVAPVSLWEFGERWPPHVTAAKRFSDLNT